MKLMNLFENNTAREKKNKLVHYKGELGDFCYDPKEFEVVNEGYGQYLHYVGFGKAVNLPKGCVNTRYMFYQCSLPYGFTLGNDFDTSKVTDMFFYV